MSNEAVVVIMVIIMCNNIMIVRITKKKELVTQTEISTVNLFHYTYVQINVRSYPIGECNVSVAN